MITYEKLGKKPVAFRSMTGLTVKEFDLLYQDLIPANEAAEIRRLSRSDRQRTIGAGRKYALSFRERLLMAVIHLRLYPSSGALGFLFSVDKSTVSRNVRRIILLLEALGCATFGWPKSGERRSASLDEIMGQCPDLLAIVDATEQRIERPQDQTAQKAHYSGKKKAHTRKTQIVVNEQGYIRHVSDSVPGSKHDRKLLQETDVYDQLPPNVPMMGDSGYQGAQKDRPDVHFELPNKGSRWHPLTAEEKAYNRVFSRIRIIVENALARVKIFRILADRYRHCLDSYNATFVAVAGLVNRRLAQSLA
jgi:hypothetical protein